MNKKEILTQEYNSKEMQNEELELSTGTTGNCNEVYTKLNLLNIIGLIETEEQKEWIESPFADLAVNMITALYALKSAEKKSAYDIGSSFLTTVINNGLKDLGTDVQITISKIKKA